jgi:hypothetical protein
VDHAVDPDVGSTSVVTWTVSMQPPGRPRHRRSALPFRIVFRSARRGLRRRGRDQARRRRSECTALRARREASVHRAAIRGRIWSVPQPARVDAVNDASAPAGRHPRRLGATACARSGLAAAHPGRRRAGSRAAGRASKLRPPDGHGRRPRSSGSGAAACRRQGVSYAKQCAPVRIRPSVSARSAARCKW